MLPIRVTTGYLVKWRVTPDGYDHQERHGSRKQAKYALAMLRSMAYHSVRIVRLYRRVRGL